MTDLKIFTTVVSFLVGAFASFALSLLLGEAFQELLPSWSIPVLALTIVTILMIDVQHVNLINSRVDKAFTELEGKNTIVMEPDIEQNNGAKKCYEELEKLVESAQKSIFIVPNPFREGEIQSWDKEPRKNYLSAIEKKVKANKEFEYRRIQQTPKQFSEGKKLKDYLGEVATEHMVNILKDGPSENVSFFKISCDEISGFMVIDDKILVKFLTAVDSSMKRKLVAITIQQHSTKNTSIENRTSSIEKFCKGLPKVLTTTQTTQIIKIEDLD